MNRRAAALLLSTALIGAAAPLLPGRAWESLASLLAPQPAIGGPFALADTRGRQVRDWDLADRPFAIFFGFTHCPEFCPATLERVSRWIAALGPDAAAIRFLVVTIDPARDTSAASADYRSHFDPHIEGLTGSRAEVSRIVAGYRVFARRVELGDGEDTLDHSAAVYLMDGASRFHSVIGYDERDEPALKRLRKLVHRDDTG